MKRSGIRWMAIGSLLAVVGCSGRSGDGIVDLDSGGTTGDRPSGGGDMPATRDSTPTGDGSGPNCMATSCGGCTPLPNCGWCRSMMRCLPGSSMGPTNMACPASDWAYLTSQCGGPTGDGGTTCPSAVPRTCNLTIAGGVRTCTPGSMVTVGCNQGCRMPLGTCTGDPVIQVCAGNNTTMPCAMAVASNDDAPESFMCESSGDAGVDTGLCPMVTFMCPAGGMYTLWTGAFGMRPATCMPAVR